MTPIIFLVLFLHKTEAVLQQLEFTKQWNDFKISYAKHFENSTEEAFRKMTFETKLKEIGEHNERYREGLETYTLGINQFTDYTDEEMLPFIQSIKVPEDYSNSLLTFSLNLSSTVPDSFDWRDQGMVTPIKNQKTCGSCWAFATLGALESHINIHYGINATLSEQQLIDCVTLGALGCNGGSISAAYNYIAVNDGINFDTDYPYEGVAGSCHYDSSKPKITVKGYAHVSEQNEEVMKEALVTRGPIAVGVDATYISGYSGGVFYNPKCSSTYVNHGMVVVGYGTEDGLDYWIVKNSWGTSWGLDGFIKMARNRDNHCGIVSYTYYPVFY